MKNLKLKSIAIIVFIASVSNFTYAQHNHGNTNMKKGNHDMMAHNDKMVKLNNKNLTKAYMHYTMIKDALIEANSEKAQKASKMLVGFLKKSGNAEQAKIIASEMASKSNITEQRIVFAELTTALEPLLKDNVVEGEIYKTFCPMANSGEGSYWFSNSSNIVNPYMGKAMASCGSVKEIFKSM